MQHSATSGGARATARRRGRAVQAVVAAAVCGLAMACTTTQDTAAPLGPDVAATVGDAVVTKAAFDARMATVLANNPDAQAAIQHPPTKAQLDAGLLGTMIDAALIGAHVTTNGPDISDAEVEAHADRMVRDELGDSPEAWAEFLDRMGYAEDEARSQFVDDLRKERLEDELVPDPEVSDAEIVGFYEKNYPGKPMVRHIVVATRAEADEVRALIDAGADFGQLARERSTDSASAKDGGELGPWIKAQYVASFDEAVEDAKDGTTVGPVESTFGFHVIQRDPPAELDAVRSEIATKLAEMKQDGAVTEWLTKRKADVRITVAAEYGRWDPATGKVVAAT